MDFRKILFTSLAVIVIGATYAIADEHPSGDKPGGPPPPLPGLLYKPELLCRRTCQGNMLSLTYFEKNVNAGDEVCPSAPSVIQPCVPYDCDAETHDCRASCSNDSHCSAGYTCDTARHECAPIEYFCSTNGVTVESTLKQTSSCSPYRCQAGQCRSKCASVNDCAPGFVCNFSSACVSASH